MRHKSRTNADEVHHFTLFCRVQAQTISGCVIRRNAFITYLWQPSSSSVHIATWSCSSPPSHRGPLVLASLFSPPFRSGTSLTPALSKLCFFPPSYRSSLPNPQRNPTAPISHVCVFERARQSSGSQLVAKVANAGCRGSSILSMSAQVRCSFLLSWLIVWLVNSRCRGPEQLHPLFLHTCAQKK